MSVRMCAYSYDSLAHLCLNMAGGDWLDIGAVDHEAKEFFEPDPAKRKTLVLQAVRHLAEAGYIKIGWLKRPDPEIEVIDFFEWQYREPDTKTALHWVEWPGTLDQRMAHLDEVYTPEAEDDRYWYYGYWLNLTDSGANAVRALPEPDDRFFEDLP